MKPQPPAKLVVMGLLAALVAATLGCILVPVRNQPPVIAKDTIVTTAVDSNLLGQILGVTTKITIQASDPDGDVLTFRWTASNGSITGNGPSGTWKRELTSGGQPIPGTATVVVTDGRGGQAEYTFTAK